MTQNTKTYHDPMLLYQTFCDAIAEWMGDHRSRFVIPPKEYWPDDVETRDEARTHYSEAAASEILENWEQRYYDAIEESQ